VNVDPRLLKQWNRAVVRSIDEYWRHPTISYNARIHGPCLRCGLDTKRLDGICVVCRKAMGWTAVEARQQQDRARHVVAR
jgi:hypothetical protein